MNVVWTSENVARERWANKWREEKKMACSLQSVGTTK